MYFDALEKRSFEELYQVHADDFYTSFIKDTCSDTRLKNVLLRNGTLTLRDLLMSSPQKVFGYYGFGRLTAIALKQYLDRMIATPNRTGNETQTSSNTPPSNRGLDKNPDSSAKQTMISENKLIPPIEPLVVDIASSGLASVQEQPIQRSAPKIIPQIQDNPREKTQQPYANFGERSNSSSQKGKTMDALLSYIGWLAPDSVETVKKVFLLLQSECKRWNCSAYMPDAVIYEDNSRTILSVANQPVLVHRIYNVIESQIDGDFEGCNGDSRYKLMNGQVWEQTNSMYKYKYAYCPKVTIIQYNSKHIMYVKGMQIPVRRV